VCARGAGLVSELGCRGVGVGVEGG
jgi:hypothetical protein